MQGLSPNVVYAVASLACAGAGAISDVRTRRIPNWIAGTGCVAGLLLHFSFGGWRSLGSAAAAGIVSGGVFLLFYLAGGMGGGDVKLMSAVCCLAGLSAVPQILVGAALTGGLAALLVALWRQRARETAGNVVRLLAHHARRGLEPHTQLNVNNPRALRLPYGLAIVAGAASSLCNVLVR